MYYCIHVYFTGGAAMVFKIVRELEKIEDTKKCDVVTCIHCIGGYCVGCESEDECEFEEKVFMQD